MSASSSYPRDLRGHAYPRDLRGHGGDPPHARWPNSARIAVQFILNYEKGGENSVLHGDAASETFLSELVTAQAYENRHMTMASMYEYGSRAGVWRILCEFDARGLPLTVFGVAMALERYRELVGEFMKRDHEIANHGLRWIHYQNLPEAATERRDVDIATKVLSSAAAPGRSAGTPAATARTRAASSSSTAATSTTVTTTATTCRVGPRSRKATATACRTSSCRIPSTPTTCASCRRSSSTPGSTSLLTCATRSTRTTPKPTRAASTGRR